jgi:hypothetical protein
MLILIGCQTKKNKLPKLNLPDMPLMNRGAVEEIKQVCIPRKACDNFNNWLNELYAFKIKYYVYKEELNK